MKRLIIIGIAVSWVLGGWFWITEGQAEKSTFMLKFEPREHSLGAIRDSSEKRDTFIMSSCPCAKGLGSIRISKEQRLRVARFIKNGIRKLEGIKANSANFLKQDIPFENIELGTVTSSGINGTDSLTVNATAMKNKEELWVRIIITINCDHESLTLQQARDFAAFLSE